MSVSTPLDHLENLAQLGHADGGWGYAPGQAPNLEASCLGLLATLGAQERFGEVITKGRRFIDQCAASDGSYRLEQGREEALWPTSLVLFTQSVLGASRDVLERTARRLLGLRGRVPDNPEAGEVQDIDVKLTGWPWAENNFSWVEPTSWAILALRAVGQGEHPRVREGVQMLLDRAMDSGGINYGNRRILGKMTDPIPTPTALMLLALQGEKHARLDAAVQYLIKQIDTGDLEHRCWIKLALDLYRDQPGVSEALRRLDDAIGRAYEARAATPWLRPAVVREALTALALGTADRKPFRLPSEKKLPEAITAASTNGKKPWTKRLGAWFRGLAVKAAGSLRQLPARSAVHIARAESYDADLTTVLVKQYESFRETVPLKDKRVVLKPNLVEYHRDKVINTNPRVVGAVIELCKREGAAEIVVAEGPGHWRNVEYLVQESGLGDVLKEHGIRFVDLNHDEPVKTPNLGRLTGLEHLFLSRTIATAEVVISLPKLKMHHWAGATLSLKNLFGTLPGVCYGWPKNELHWRGIDNSIVDIALTRTPELAIVDGIIGMEGDGPLNGTAKPMGVLVMGNDLVALDGTCCRLMELDPEQIGYLVLGQNKKLGRLNAAEIQQLGESVESVAKPFETVPHLEKIRRRRSA
jgi:uncharacterized protein (DUF362 family)